jgi:predicted component of type VI protein secretion system
MKGQTMSSYEYNVIPAPARAEKAKGARTGIDRFAATLSDVLNDMARDGWEYVRAETLPAEERSGLTSRSTVYHNVLIFRRALASDVGAAPRIESRPAEPPAAPRIETDHAAPRIEANLAAPSAEPAAPSAVRAPFSQPMRSTAAPTTKAAPAAPRPAEPPLTRSPAHPLTPPGPRLGPASR